VQVTDVTDFFFTLTTLKGHPEAASIVFSADQLTPSRIQFNINVTGHPASMGYSFAYSHGGRAFQKRIWTNTLRQGIKSSGGKGTITTREIYLKR
jgi:hypothetical protein